MSSYRTELGGIVAALYLIQRICEYYDMAVGKATLYCDNKGAITKSFQPVTPGISPFMSPSYDLLLLAKQLIARIPITLIGEWVKGHYTGKDRRIQHDLNDRADEIAGGHLAAQDNSTGTNTGTIPYPGYRIRILKDNKVTSSKYRAIISNGRHNQLLIDYILKKTKWSNTEFQKVHCVAHGKAFQQLTRHQQIFTAKLIHNLANTNKQNYLYYKTSSLCPGCQTTEETFEHVLLCPLPQTIQYRQLILEHLHIQLRKIQTPLPVIEAIMKGFKDWEEKPSGRSRAPTYGSLLGPDILLTSVYYEQFYQLGWFQLCLGRISHKWSQAVAAYHLQTCPTFDEV
jgi:hypothetical protein